MPVQFGYSIIFSVQFNVHAVNLFIVQLMKASLVKMGAFGKVGVVTLNFSAGSAHTLLKEPPILKFLDPPLENVLQPTCLEYARHHYLLHAMCEYHTLAIHV